TEQDSLPATLSRTIVHGLLRQQLGFTGLIISDCLEMQAISATFGTAPAAVMALEAGIDLVLVSHHYEVQRASIEAIYSAVQTAQQITPQVITQAAERVLQLKARYLSWDTLPTLTTTPPPTIGCNAHLQLQRESYQRSTTLIRNEDALLPLHLEPEEQIIILSPQRNSATMVEDRYYSDETLAATIRRYHPLVGILPVDLEAEENGYKHLLQTTSETAVFIIATVNAHLDERQAALVRSLMAAKRRTIVIAVRNPYDLMAFPQVRTFLATYEYTQPALVAAARIIFGKSEAQGHLPVHIPASSS
ncbi:MAG TPA: glycoside hydrolase family 3 N-terminal domain-containing protein, partial [Ktedonobacteraceae bacterium]|nr:glycoside hydrolase family 3 N-terminal domain-containing protein [Ktedonobacteraceae bacterium]